MGSQRYEKYWNITLEYSDINGQKFINVLRIIISFIDENNLNVIEFDSSHYKDLQERINSVYPKRDMASTRKSINQFVKLGFVMPYLSGYHQYTPEFLLAQSNEKRKLLFSTILYDNGRFDASATKNSEIREINFLMKTLAYSGPLSKEDIGALMLMDISLINRDFATREELEEHKQLSSTIGFLERKYNQVGYLCNILKLLAEVQFTNNLFYLSDENVLDNSILTKKRDPYLHRLYKAGLQEESIRLYNEVQCFVEKLPYKGLVASHMKPFRDSNYLEEYNSNNGLLLSQNIDVYFDKFDISFDNEGNMLIGKDVKERVKEHIEIYKLDPEILTPERLEFLEYHRQKFFEKNQ